MRKIIQKCPACAADMMVQSLVCPECNLEIRNKFPISPFEQLSEEQHEFLKIFLQSHGKLGAVQEAMGLSYPAVKEALEEINSVLGFQNNNQEERMIDVKHWKVEEKSNKASDLIKRKLKEAGGMAMIPTYDGTLRRVVANADGNTFICEKIPVNYDYVIFDMIVDLLISQGGKARKGNGRNYRLGEKNCEADTVAGCIGFEYLKKNAGEAILDPVYILAAILDWAGIAHNKHGFIELTAAYKERI